MMSHILHPRAQCGAQCGAQFRRLLLLAALALCVIPGCHSGSSTGSQPEGGSTSASSQGSSGAGAASGNSGSGTTGHGAGSSGTSGAGASSADTEAPQGTVTIPLDQQATAGIRVVALEPTQVPRTLSVPGQVGMDEQRTAHIAPYSDGRVVDVIHNTGDHVRRGEALAHLHSHSVHETVGALAMNFSNLNRAQAALTYAQAKRDRYAHLYAIQAASLEQQQASQGELLQAQTDVKNAEAAVTMEREHLGDLLQISPESITPANLYSFELVPIESPIAGTVITRSVTPGMVLEPGQEAYTVANLDSVWMTASVNQADLDHLRLGQRATVRTNAWPNETFAGTVTLLGSTLDPTTRTVQVRVSVPNRAGKLRPLMFATAAIDEAAAGSTRAALFIPEDAIQEINGVPSAFITTDGTRFAPRALQTAPPVAGQVEVTGGLRPGEHVAVAGAFVLKSALLKSSIDSE